jgi:hypothetical protein
MGGRIGRSDQMLSAKVVELEAEVARLRNRPEASDQTQQDSIDGFKTVIDAERIKRVNQMGGRIGRSNQAGRPEASDQAQQDSIDGVKTVSMLQEEQEASDQAQKDSIDGFKTVRMLQDEHAKATAQLKAQHADERNALRELVRVVTTSQP